MSSEAWAAPAEPDAPAAPQAEGGVSRIGRNFAALASGQLVTWTMSLLWTIVVPRVLGPGGMGMIVTALAVTGVFSIFLGLGTRNYLVREMVVDPEAAPRLLATGLALRLALTPLFVIGIAVYAQFAHYSHDGTIVLYLATAASLLILLAEPMQAAFQAIERMKYLAYSDVINKSSQGILGVILVLVGFRAIGLTASSVVVAAVVVVLDVYWLARYLRVDVRTTFREIVSLTKHSMSFLAMGLFFMIYLWIDSVMLSLMTRPEVVGWYGVPTKLFQTLMFLPALLSMAWLPRLVDAFQEAPERLHTAARKPMELIAVLSAPICAGTVILARPVIDALYGSAYGKAAPVMIVLGLCIPPMYLNVILCQVLIAANRQRAWTWVMALATIVNPALNVALIRITEHRYGNGAIGAALSLLVTEVVIVAIGVVMVGRVFDRHMVRRCAVATIASVAMWLVAYALGGIGTIPAFVAGVATFVAIAAVFKLATPDEVAFVRSKAARVVARFA
jgi:O-antigen/teichoic acid export membrane protein